MIEKEVISRQNKPSRSLIIVNVESGARVRYALLGKMVAAPGDSASTNDVNYAADWHRGRNPAIG